MLWKYLALLQDIGWENLVDICLAAILIWFGLHVLRTMRTNKVGAGLLAFLLLTLIAHQFGLQLTVWILQGISALIVLVIIVVYQGEIRRILERFPGSLRGRTKAGRATENDLLDLVVSSLGTLAGSKTGALVVLAGDEPLEGLVSSGIALDARPSKPLLLSIFDPNSPGHDGALLIDRGKFHSFGLRLPLSEQEEPLREKGTRHAAGLGLAEKTDALVLVVSEESGHISVAREGRLSTLTGTNELRRELQTFFSRNAPAAEQTGRSRHARWWAALEGLSGLAIAAMLWLFVVAGADVQTVSYEVPIEVQNIPEGYVLRSVTPERIAVSLTGKKRSFFTVRPEDLVIRLDGTLTRFGRQTFPITHAHLLLPPEIELADLAPGQVRVIVHEAE